jgi:transposase
MAAPYSRDLRAKVLSAYENGFKTKQIAVMFSISPAWARRVKQRFRENDEVEARPMGGRRRRSVDLGMLAKLVEEQPDATLEEFREQMGGTCSTSAIDRALRAMNLTFKKRQSMHRNGIGRTSSSGVESGGMT